MVELVDVGEDVVDVGVGTVEVGTVDDGESSEAVVTGTGDVSEIVTASDSAGPAAGARLSIVVVHAASTAIGAAIHILVRRVITGANRTERRPPDSGRPSAPGQRPTPVGEFRRIPVELGEPLLAGEPVGHAGDVGHRRPEGVGAAGVEMIDVDIDRGRGRWPGGWRAAGRRSARRGPAAAR